MVWKARQESTGRLVAVKLLSQRGLGSDRSQRRFEREVALCARLEHPGIVRIYDSGLHQGMYFYAMELVEGLPLDEVCAAQCAQRTAYDRAVHPRLRGRAVCPWQGG